MIEVIGYIAATCTAVSFLPQALLVYRTNKTEGISLNMFLIFCTGLVAWLWYGFAINQYPVILANSFTMILAGYILVKKISHLRQK